jgi:hypothetical protein
MCRIANFRRFLTARKVPGWAFIALFIFDNVPDWKGRFDFWADAASHSSVYLTIMVTVISSPIFSVFLLAAGLGYLLFIGEPPVGVQRHWIWPVAGWSVFSICFVSMGCVIGITYFQVLVDQRAQILASEQIKHFRDEQLFERTFNDDSFHRVAETKTILKPVAIVALRDPEITQLAIHLTKSFRNSSVNVIGFPNPKDDWFWQADGTRSLKGVMVLVRENNTPNEDEKGIFDILQKSSLNPRYEPLTSKWIIDAIPNATIIFLGYN